MYELFVEIVNSARRSNVVRCYDIFVASICCCLDGGYLYCSIYFVREVDIFRGCVWEHRLIRASTAATGLRETASAPLCRLPVHCWILKEYLRHFPFSQKRRGLYTLLRSVTKYSCQLLMISYYYHLWAAHDEYSAPLKCPGDYNCFAFSRCIPAFCVGGEPVNFKYNASSIGTSAIIGSQCLPSSLELGRLICKCRRW